MGRAGELWSLPATDRWLLLSAAALLATTRLSLPVAGPGGVRGPLEWLARWLPPSGPVGDPDRIARAVRTARRRLPAAPACLGTAVVARAMLAAHGHPSDLRIGVARPGSGELEAHAWVERDGRVLVGDVPDLARFRPLSTDGGTREAGPAAGW